MPRKNAPPVKAACLACRSSKTRCDGQSPCGPCVERGRDCVYRPSRRGGRRDRIRKAQGSDDTTTLSESSILSLPESVSTRTSIAPEYTFMPTDVTLPPEQQIDPALQSIVGLLSPHWVPPEQSSSTATPNEPDTANSDDRGLPMLRIYKSESDIIDAYYLYIHPYLPLLPPPVIALVEDRAVILQPQPEEVCTVDRSSTPYWPTSSLTLALSAILSLIPLPQDAYPSEECRFWLRRSWANLYAQAALSAAERETDDLTTGGTDPATQTAREDIHPDVPRRLLPILALVVLSVYEICQRGNIPRMRTRANQAITAALDLSLHTLGADATEAQRRTWWAATLVAYHSSVLHSLKPIITATDTRITTPFPILNPSSEAPEPWPILLSAEEAMLSVQRVVKAQDLGGNGTPLPSNLRSEIRSLDTHLATLAAKCDPYMHKAVNKTPESLASQCLGMISCLIIHSARINLHRLMAFREIPIFLEKHCDLAAIPINDVSPVASFSSLPAGFETVFPFTEQESSVICLKSALATARTLRNMPCPNLSPNNPGHGNRGEGSHPPTTLQMPTLWNEIVAPSTLIGSIPYFKCAAMQAGYAIFMLLHRVRTALVSNRLSTCYHLLPGPEPGTEDAERLLEELRHGAESLMLSLRRDVSFEGTSAMSRDFEAATQSTICTRLPIVLYSHPHGPNLWKVAIVLEELALPYETRFVNFCDVKKEPYTKLNPNGRLPTIEDPNRGITLFESGAIVEYLVDTYDTEAKLKYNDLALKYEGKAWLHLQVSGQGPYYGQASWFTRFAPEWIPIAIERYGNEIRRVMGVLESALEKREWLVGDRCTYADLCFMPWQRWAERYATRPETLDEDFPHVAAWYQKMMAMPSVKQAFEDQDRAIEDATGV